MRREPESGPAQLYCSSRQERPQRGVRPPDRPFAWPRGHASFFCEILALRANLAVKLESRYESILTGQPVTNGKGNTDVVSTAVANSAQPEIRVRVELGPRSYEVRVVSGQGEGFGAFARSALETTWSGRNCRRALLVTD